MRLIDADAFDRELVAYEFDAAMNRCADEDRPFTLIPMEYPTESIREMLKKQPTIHKELRHGRWMEKEDQIQVYYCSRCGYTVGLEWLIYKYCPVCGAKMEVDDNKKIKQTIKHI